MGMGGGNDPNNRGVLAEINVTPLVDVMLVLLIIFMVAAGVQTVEMESERSQLLAEAEEKLEEAEDLLLEVNKKKKDQHQKVSVDLPRVNNQAVNLSEVKKLKLEVGPRLTFAIGDIKLLDCLELSPAMARYVDGTANDIVGEQQAFEPCLKRLGDKLVDNKKLQEDKELYVLADRSLDYGLVLRVMAAVRQAGVHKFGLVAEPGLLGGAGVTRTPKAIP